MSTSPILDPQELVVFVDHRLGYCEYHGPRAELEAEGLIPDGLVWPKGYSNCTWDAGPFRFWLVRWRPAGAKGPRRQFHDCDWWHLRWQFRDRRDLGAVRIHRESQALEQMIRFYSPEGQAERDRDYSRYAAACWDEQFQVFKALVPGLVPPARVRRMAKGATPKEPVSSGGEA